MHAGGELGLLPAPVAGRMLVLGAAGRSCVEMRPIRSDSAADCSAQLWIVLRWPLGLGSEGGSDSFQNTPLGLGQSNKQC